MTAPSHDPGSVEAVLEGLAPLTKAYVPGDHEGPGALVDEPVWRSAVRRLADVILSGSESGDIESPPDDPVVQYLFGGDVPSYAAPLSPAPSGAEDGVLFVLGVGRSGTTWLQGLLLACPTVGGIEGESFLFRLCDGLWRRRTLFVAICDEERLVRALREFADTIFSRALELHSPEARIFVEKTPRHAMLLPMISRVYPNAAYIHIVRDGRDVARSMVAVPFFGVRTLRDGGRIWREVLHEVALRGPALARFRKVHYEELLADPVGGVGDLLEWMALPSGADVRAEIAQRAGKRVSTHAGTSKPVGQGTWRDLPARDLAELIAECGPELCEEGYVTRRELLRWTWRPAYWRWRVVRLGAHRRAYWLNRFRR